LNDRDCETDCTPEQEQESARARREADRIVPKRKGHLIETSTANPGVNLPGPKPKEEAEQEDKSAHDSENDHGRLPANTCGQP
jgi:hypothetical protein